MGFWTTAWLVLVGLSLLVWTIRHVIVSLALRRMPALRADPRPLDPADAPPLTMLVAAKDEEANIERCIRSLLKQDYPGLRLIAINDRSTDRTPQILDTLAAADSRLTVIHVTALREGWFGKNNAMREGIERCNTPWMCFTDADCTFTSPHALSTAMRHARATDAEFLSILPTLEAHSILEQMIQPACSGILLIWFNPLFVNNPRRTTAYANGAFMLMTREAYERIGGHEPVKTEVNEDIHMARLAKQAGVRLRVMPNDDLYCVRMYSSFAQMWRGWSRIFYGCFGSVKRVVLSFLAVSTFGIQPWASAALAAYFGLVGRNEAPVPVFWTALAASLMQLTVMLRYYRATKIPMWLAPTYPLAACLALGMLVSAARRMSGRGTTTWRGTTYRGSAVVQAR